MKLSLKEFNVLVYLEQNQLAAGPLVGNVEIAGMDKPQLSATMTMLAVGGLIETRNGLYALTEEGRASLEPYRVKRALFMAAGFGKRMVPISLNTPKPLIRVHGKPMIETLLDAVLRAEIEDIIIVRGYLGEQFDLLLKKYPMVKFVDNPYYEQANNISSTLYFKGLMENAYVLESDLVLYNPDLIRKYEYSTNYLGMKVDYTDDWCFRVKNGYIEEMLIGGYDVYHMYGISYWDKTDARKMDEDIATVYNLEGGSQKYWDEVALKYCFDRYRIMVRPVGKGDIVEIDSFDELKEIDPAYA